MVKISELTEATAPLGPDDLVAIVQGVTTKKAKARYLKRSLAYDVRDYGATGDGSTSDRLAIQAAIDAATAAGGGTVYLPQGRYRLPAPLVPASSIDFRGDGPGRTILAPDGGQAAVQLFGTELAPLVDSRYYDFEIDGTNQSGAYSSAIKGIYCKYMLRPVFHNLYVHDTGATGLGVDFLVNGIFSDCVVDHCGRLNDGTQPGGSGIGVAVGLIANESCVVVNCHALNCGRNGIFFERATGYTYAPRGVTVTGCVARGNQRGIADAGCENMAIVGNVASDNTQYGIGVDFGTFGPATPGQHGQIRGNIVHDNDVGIYHGGIRGPYTIAGNSSHDNNTGIYLESTAAGAAAWVGVAENAVYGNDGAGIHVLASGAGAWSRVDVSRNRVFENGQDAGESVRDGIRVTGPTNDLRVVGNLVADDQGTRTQQVGIRLAAGAHARPTITDNDCRTNAGNGIDTSAGTLTSSTVERNYT